MRETQILWEHHDAAGSSYRALHVDDDGTLVIEGQDVGDDVESVLGTGLREYEFERCLEPSAVGRLRETLGIEPDEPLLPALRSRLGSTNALERVVADNDIPSAFWSRIGD